MATSPIEVSSDDSVDRRSHVTHKRSRPLPPVGFMCQPHLFWMDVLAVLSQSLALQAYHVKLWSRLPVSSRLQAGESSKPSSIWEKPMVVFVCVAARHKQDWLTYKEVLSLTLYTCTKCLCCVKKRISDCPANYGHHMRLLAYCHEH